MSSKTEGLRRVAKRWHRRALNLYFRMRYWRRFYPAEPLAGTAIKVDMWNRNWRLFCERGGWERDVENVVADYLQPGDVVLDVGAQVGMLTSQAAHLVGPTGAVVSFEPDPENYAVLSALVARNYLDNVYHHHLGLSDRNGHIELRRPVGSWGSFMVGESRSALDTGFHATDFVEFTVACQRLDDFMKSLTLGRLDLVKLDVDGPEVAVLKGACDTLKLYQPVVIVEASRHYADHGYSVTDLIELMTGLGYELYYAQRNSTRYTLCQMPEDLTIDISVRGNAVDFFGLPKDNDNPRIQVLKSSLAGASETVTA